MREALGHRGYLLLTLGFFVCGFQVVFIGVHLPAYLADQGMPRRTSRSRAGADRPVQHRRHLHDRLARRPHAASATSCRRSTSRARVVIALFVWLPLTPWRVYAFAIALGLLWLSTVPPTNGIVAQIFGVRYLGDAVGLRRSSATRSAASSARGWAASSTTPPAATTSSGGSSIALGVVAGLINLPIDERGNPAPGAGMTGSGASASPGRVDWCSRAGTRSAGSGAAGRRSGQRRRRRQRIGGDVVDGVGDDAVDAPRRPARATRAASFGV